MAKHKIQLGMKITREGEKFSKTLQTYYNCGAESMEKIERSIVMSLVALQGGGDPSKTATLAVVKKGRRKSAPLVVSKRRGRKSKK